MFERDIFHHYQLVCEEKKVHKGYRTFRCKGDHFIVVPQRKLTYDEIQEMIYLGDFLKQKGERGIASLWPTITNMPSAYVDGESVLIFKLDPDEESRGLSVGENLAEFHKRSKGLDQYYPTQRNAHGQWPLLWSDRVDLMQKKYGEIQQRKIKNDFDRLFLTTFPYYEGLAENAIQYIVDFSFERGPRGIGTPSVCYERFSTQSWVEYDRGLAKLPVGWIIDHPMRDAAEWIRSKIYESEFRSHTILEFIDDYEKVKPLSRGSWRLLYGRLLFPANYFDLVEGHYENEKEIGRELFVRSFNDIVTKEEQNEQFLRSFYRSIGLPLQELNIPIVDWLLPSY